MTGDVAKGIMVIHKGFKSIFGSGGPYIRRGHFGGTDSRIKTNDD